ncbi:uncharacterized protein LOC111134695 [Crassostrea virginica]|uniref:Uncharacterized protein LOC111138444 n=1 Tax=Crassostrea virginica TaxID=6565 RepID=A0A8B8F2S3_CRAVI|nr:uncharacterized protein LOC111138444 [Crassostrea virginica]|mmetsp:Transcript_36325/g.58193  ORF Transcript_36325/g.58193 Transcript_36325/m.58193 type:complete len:251 (-) Transcript_36325:812-1564(-)
MKSIQLLVFVVFFVAQSSSQDEEDGRRRPNYVVVDKHINVREIIRFGGKRGAVQDGVEEFEVPGDDNSAPYQSPFSSLLAKVSNAAKWRKVQNMLPLSGIQYFLGDMGTAEVCGPPGAHINISWSPKVIDPQKSVKIYFDVTIPIDFNKGKGHVDVYMEDSPDPIFSVDQDFGCDDIAKKASMIKCPLKKGSHYAFSFVYSELDRLPVGKYTLGVKITDDHNNLFACLNMTLVIKPSEHLSMHPPPQIIH